MNSLIDVFPVPPFLLPVYQAAGNDYGVPWPVLAAINEIETDYGRNLSVSSAGAVGWMQFLPSTWAKYGLDADGSGSANPYDPIDAIFAAARYLHAAGAGRNLSSAVFAYNHAQWYVNSVLLRARLLALMPAGLVDGLTGLMEASFPIAGHLGPYATRPPVRMRVDGAPAVMLNGPSRAPVIAVADGRVVDLGRDRARGRYMTIEDSYGNQYTYSHLGSLERVYPVLRPKVESAARTASALDLQPAFRTGSRMAAATTELPGPRGHASAVSRPATTGSRSKVSVAGGLEPASVRTRWPAPTPMVKERLFADPLRPASYTAGGWLQLQTNVAFYASATGLRIGTGGPLDYFSEPVSLRPVDFELAALRRGSTVVAGTVLGRVGAGRQGRTGIVFQIRPAGATSPVDPTPIIAGWQLLGRLTAGHSALVGVGASGAFGAPNMSLGQLLQASKSHLQRAVLSDPGVTVYACGRRDIASGRVDRRVLAMIEYLSYSGLGPSISGLVCAQPKASDASSGTRVDISAFDGIPVAGHQQDGGIVDLAIRQLLRLDGALRPARIVSLRSYPWQPATVAVPDHQAEVEIDFSPPAAVGAGPTPDVLTGTEWTRLIGRLTQLAGQPGAASPFVEQVGGAK